ncbi:transcription elongation factor, mitochondrial [Sitophilus oryzae]|uniref:Transcription elongation factor, mitochondrial n=1 Tax=Sitophilus oryzae TaxID=7048 RepID=A0A6J2YB23_SITOR|nr:transcription elongation factor, mitochondrial [Sitophilus oryzae]
MLSFSKNLFRKHRNFASLVKHISTNESSTPYYFDSKFTPEDDNRILNALNKSDPDELKQFKLPINRIKKIIDWRESNGPFKTLGDVLRIDGIEETILEQVCVKIAQANGSSEKLKRSKPQNRSYLTPDLPPHILNSFKSAVAIHLDPVGLSVVRLERNENTLTNWFSESFSQLPVKMFHTDTFYLAINIIRKIPQADLYVFESAQSLNLQNQSKPSMVSTYNQQMELLAMLLALLNTSMVHNPLGIKEGSTNVENRVFYLKSRVAARLFKTLIGSEKVSPVVKIGEFIRMKNKSEIFCCTPMNIDDSYVLKFDKEVSKSKELLSQALMLGCAFMDLCVYKNPDSIETLNSFRRNNK